MAFQFDSLTPTGLDQATDSGLRAFLARVYFKVAGGLVLSAAIAWCISNVTVLRELFFVSVQGEVAGFTGLGLALIVSPLFVLLLASFVIRDHTARGAGLVYWTVAALVGASLSLLVMTYTGATLASTFLVTAGAFAGLSLWGALTRRNLASVGSFLATALVGLILAMLVNMLFRDTLASLVLNVIGVLIFAGLIATDTQRLRRIYYATPGPDALEASANYGALSLYLNFVNLFQLLLSLSSGRSRR